MTIVAVIGKGLDCPRSVADLAFDVGRELGCFDVTIVTGGLGGVMAAASEGARSVGLTVVSLVPVGRDDDAHPYASVALRTGLPEAYRNVLMASCADVGVMLPGAWGTTQEAAVMVDRGVPVFGVGEHEGWRTANLHGVDYGPDPEAVAAWLASLLTGLDAALPADPLAP